MTLWIEQRGLCWICCEPMLRFVSDHPLKVSRDHLLPRSRRGNNAVRNYLLAHRKCNTSRGAPKLNKTKGDIQSMKRDAMARLRQSPHWIEDYQDPESGAYRGDFKYKPRYRR